MKKWIASGGDCLVSQSLISGQGKLLWAWRESPLSIQDSGWRFLSDKDSEITLMDDSTLLVDINYVANIEPTIVGIYWYPIGADFQFSSYKGKKHFVYNNDFKQVKLVTSINDLPIDTPSFKQHFPDYDLLSAKHSLNTARFSTEELSQLNSSKYELEQVTSALVGEGNSNITTQELYILTGILLGYIEKQSQILPISWSNQRKTLTAYLAERFDQRHQTIRYFIDSYLDLPGDGSQLSHTQLIKYGQTMYSLVQKEQYEEINQEYLNIINHHQKVMHT